MTKPWRPSNGTDGMWFESKFCDKCGLETWDPETDKGIKCSILDGMILYGVDKKEYPGELIYDENGKPTCTAFKLPSPRKKPEPKIPGQMTF